MTGQDRAVMAAKHESIEKMKAFAPFSGRYNDGNLLNHLLMNVITNCVRSKTGYDMDME
jgi:hypothetical protein